MQKLPAYQKSIIFITLLLALAFATPALADYLGPDRTVTTYVSYCRYVQKRCAQQKNGQWEWNTVEDWDCSHGDRGCSGGGGACNKANDGARSCERDEGVREETVTYDPATIGGTIHCTEQNGWCNGGSVPEIALSAQEPLSGYNILLIEGTRNGASFACQNGEVNCSVPLLEGENSFNFWALSSWGDSSLMGNQNARVDTVPPEVGLSVTGTAGHNGWYKSMIDVSAIASDATSGVAKFEVAEDGGAYEGYSPTAFGDGLHTLQFRVVDNAGNVFEAPLQNFNVDTVPPTIDLPAAWYLGKEVEYEVRDNGSGLAAVRVVIEDEDEKYAKVTSDRNASGKSYSSHMDWNGQFKDKTVAPPGTYLVWVKARDVAGNERFEMGKVIVPEPKVALMVLPTADPLATEVALLPPTELTDVEDIPVTAGQSAVEGTTIEASSTTTQTILLTTGSAGATASTTTSGVLWGAAAAAAIASATSYALGVAQKRKEEEEAQAAAVRAEVAQSKAERAENHMTKEEKKEQKAERAQAHDEKVQERKERQSWENPAKEKELLRQQEERDEAYRQWLEQKKQEEAAAREQRRQEEARTRAEQKWEQQEALAEQRWINIQERQEKKRDAEEAAARNAQMTASLPGYSAEKQEKVTVEKKESWWEKTKDFVKDNIIDPVNEKIVQPYVVPYVEQRVEGAKEISAWVNEKIYEPYIKPHVEPVVQKAKKVVDDVKKAGEKALLWIDQHQAEVALGIGVAVGVAAIILSGGLAAPLVAAAWVAGAAVVAAGTVAVGTIALNLHYEREWNENLIANMVLSGLSAAAISGGWFLFQGAIAAAGPFCAANSSICGRIEPILNAIDGGEQLWLSAKLGYQNWIGDQAGAADTALELQMEQMDGGMPGNSILKEVGEETLEKVAKYGDEALSLVTRYGADAAEIIATYGDDGIAILMKYGDDAIDLVARYKDDSFKFVKRAEKLGVNPTDVLDDPPLSGQTLEGWLLGIDDTNNPVNMPLKLNLSDAEIDQLRKESIQNPDSKLFSIGYGKDAKIPFDKMASNFGDDYKMGFLGMPDSKWTKYGETGAYGDFWEVNSDVVEWGIEQRKIFVLNVDYDLATDATNPSSTRRFTYAELKLIERPVNNYTLVNNGEYSFFVPNELLDTYEDFLPPELLIP